MRIETGPTNGSSLVHNKEGGHIVETAIEARAGFLDRPALAVLTVSTCLIIGAFAMIFIVFFAG